MLLKRKGVDSVECWGLGKTVSTHMMDVNENVIFNVVDESRVNGNQVLDACQIFRGFIK